MQRIGWGIFILVWLMGSIGGKYPQLQPTAPPGKIDTQVLEDTAGSRSASFLVLLKSQAFLDNLAAPSLSGEARYTRAVGALQQAARASQPAVIARLKSTAAGQGNSHPHYKTFWLVNLIEAEGNRAIVAALAAMPEVQRILPNRAFRVPLEAPQPATTSAAQGVEWNIGMVHAPDLWVRGITGQGIVYASADTGVQWDHPALISHYRGWNGKTADHNYNWWDAVDQQVNTSPSTCGYSSPVPCDDYGHGTHVMGTGVGDDGAGNQIGVAPGAKWIACRNMDGPVGRPDFYIACLQFFVQPTDLTGNNSRSDLHADVISNSYSCPPSEECISPYILHQAIANVNAAGIFMAASAGNAGPACGTITDPPGNDPLVMTVGSVDASGVIAGDSSRGPVTWNSATIMKPEIVAPGVNVRSSYPVNNYMWLSGTSMASPHIAGAVALLWSAFKVMRGDVSGTESLLEHTAIPHTTTDGCGGDTATSQPNNTYGSGLVDVYSAYLKEFPIAFPYRVYFPIVGR